MDEKKMLDRIKKSADNLEIPDSLKPENMEEMVRNSIPGKKGTAFVYRAGGLAAVLLLTLIVVWQVRRIGVLENESGFNAPVQETAATEEVEEAGSSQEIIPHVENYEDIYRALAGIYSKERSRQRDDIVLEGSIEEAKKEDVLIEGIMEAQDQEFAEAPVEEAKVAEDSSYTAAADSGSQDYSRTNIQELGVDEGDIIKTDGEYIYILDTYGTLYIVRAVNGNMELTSTIDLPDLGGIVEEMYLDGHTLSLIVSGDFSSMEETEEDVYSLEDSDFVELYTWNIKDRANPVLLASIIQEGWYRSSRKTGDYIYLFTEYMPDIEEGNKVERYVPAVEGKKLQVEDIYMPEILNSPNYLVATSVNINSPGIIQDKKAIISAANLFYVSTKNIYICNSDWNGTIDTTQIMKFHYENGKYQAVASGKVPGSLNNSFSMNENEGYLRMVTTDWRNNTTSNNLYVLDSNLKICGRINRLAPGETIQSARFMGNTGYFVTFRQVDPLFSVDLTDPKNPAILGELKITGFSSYLHFYEDNKLLGIGNEVDPDTGEYKGIKLSMFDISNPSDVTESDKYILKDTYYCPGLWNHREIMIDPEKNIFGFQVEEMYVIFQYEEESGFVNVFSEDLNKTYKYDYYDNIRGVYIGNTFYLCNTEKIVAYDMTNKFKNIGKLEFEK